MATEEPGSRPSDGDEPRRRRRWRHGGTRPAPGVPGRRPRRRQDLQDARGGPPAARTRHRRGGRVRRGARPPAHRDPAGRAGGRAADHDHLPGHRVHRDGPGRGAGPAPRGRPGRRAGAHQRPGLPQREALAGRRRAARRWHHCHHDREYPAPGIAERRGPGDHRGTAAGDRSRRGGPARGSDRAGRHDAGGPAPPDGARQHLPTGQGRRRVEQLLPGRQPHRAARTRTAVARRQGRRPTGPVPGRSSHHRHLGGAGKGGRRVVRRTGGRHPDPTGGPDRRPHQGHRSGRGAHRAVRRAHRAGTGAPGPATHTGGEPGRDVPPCSRWRHPHGITGFRPRGERHPARAGRQPARPIRAVVRPRGRRHHHRRVRSDRRAPGHARAGQPGPSQPAVVRARRADPAPADRRVRPGRGRHAFADCCSRSAAGTIGPDQRHPRAAARGGGGGPGRRAAPGAAGRDRRVPAAQLLLRAAAAPVHHRRGREPARPAGVPAGGGGRQPGGGPGRPADGAGGPGAGGGGHPVHHRRQCAARRASADRPARAGAGDVRAGERDAAGTGSRQRRRAGRAARTRGLAGRRVCGWAAVRRPRRRRRRGADRRGADAGAARAGAGRRRPAGPGGVRRRDGGRAAAGAAGRAGRRDDRIGRGRPAAHRPAHRGQPRLPHPAGRGKGGSHEPAQPRHHLRRARTRPSCWQPPRSPWIG